MTKLKSASYWEEFWEDSNMYTMQDVIKLAQQNAIEAAIELATESADEIDKHSLINHPNLKL